MLTKGASDIRGIRSLNTRPGIISESNGFLKLYQLAAEKDHLLKKLEWVKRQKDQTEKRLSEIARAVNTVEARVKRAATSNVHAELHRTSITY